MKILSGGICHETNTFAAKPTTLDDFVRDSGGDAGFAAEAIRARYEGTATIHGGYLDGARESGATLVPLLQADTTPGGLVEQAAFEHLKGLLLERMEQALPADGVLLDLHGAMVTEQHEDAEGELLRAVRELVGPNVPIVATLDLHANITPLLAGQADVLIGFDTYPHVDMYERGAEAARLIAQMVRGEVRPAMHYRQLPLLTMLPKQCTMLEPMRSLVEGMHALEAEPGVLSATLAMGFPFADIGDAGCSVLMTTDGDAALAEAKCAALAERVWERRDEFAVELTPVEEVIRYVREEAQGTVVLADGSDNPGGGAPCDGTVILQQLIEAGMEGAVVGVLYDPETAAQAHAAGVGATIEAVIGGKTDRLHGAPVRASAYVRMLGDGRFTYRSPMGRGMQGNLGRMAVLVIGGVEVVVSERRSQLRDAEMLRCVGIEPLHRRLVAVKSAVHFRADFTDIAERIFDADTPGVHRPDFSWMHYRRLRRPIYPLDAM